MGAAFAIQVMTGKEVNVKKLLDWTFSRNEIAKTWVKEVHAFTEVTKRVLHSGFGKLVETAVMPGYIFIEMSYQADERNSTAHLPAELWHLIKRVPGVLKLFGDAGQIIGKEAFDAMLGRTDTEEHVELALDAPAQDTEEVAIAEEVAESLHELNMAKTRVEKIKAESKFNAAVEAEELLHTKEVGKEEVGFVTKSINELKSKIQQSSMLDRVKVFIKSKKEIVRLPRSTFTELVMRFNSEGSLSTFFNAEQFMKSLSALIRSEVKAE